MLADNGNDRYEVGMLSVGVAGLSTACELGRRRLLILEVNHGKGRGTLSGGDDVPWFKVDARAARMSSAGAGSDMSHLSVGIGAGAAGFLDLLEERVR